MSDIITAVTAPGLYDNIDERTYHGDPLPSPSLSSSIAKLLVTRSPRHAFHQHPRLNLAKTLDDDAPTKAMDIGTAVHKTILGKGRDVVMLAFDDYRKNAAKDARDAARAAGKVPILVDDMARVTLLAEACRDQIASTELAGIFDAGTPEVTMAWQEANGIWCRGRLDFLPHIARDGGHITLVDLKTTGGSAAPDDWSGRAFDLAYDIQAVFYPRGLRALIPSIRSVAFKFLVLEQDEPFGLSVNEFSGQAIEEAAQLVELAVAMWGACLSRGQWPGYETHTAAIDPPHWRSIRAELRRLALLNRVTDWQRPLEIEGVKI